MLCVRGGHALPTAGPNISTQLWNRWEDPIACQTSTSWGACGAAQMDLRKGDGRQVRGERENV